MIGRRLPVGSGRFSNRRQRLNSSFSSDVHLALGRWFMAVFNSIATSRKNTHDPLATGGPLRHAPQLSTLGNRQDRAVTHCDPPQNRHLMRSGHRRQNCHIVSPSGHKLLEIALGLERMHGLGIIHENIEIIHSILAWRLQSCTQILPDRCLREQ